jgi:hypothetical protein
VRRIDPPSEPAGYFKMTRDLCGEAQHLYPDTLITFANDGPWDQAMSPLLTTTMLSIPDVLVA